MIKNKEKLTDIFGDQIRYNEQLEKYSWFKIGGPAEIFFKPRDENQLQSFLRTTKDMKKNFHILGLGSNTLYRDGGFKGIAIKLSSKFSFVKILKKNIIEVGAATMDKKVSDFAADNSIMGFEFLSCIPGCIGGAIKMNSGCYDYDISKILISVTAINFNGEKVEIPKEKINFSYRGCDLPNDMVIISGKFIGKPSIKDLIKNNQKKLIERKKISQPSKINTCGSTFKNTKQKKAWELIRAANCENISVGQASISEKHCNFFTNKGGAKSQDIEELILKVRTKVLEKTGVKLDLEIKIIGEN